jgi:hypothetical protein
VNLRKDHYHTSSLLASVDSNNKRRVRGVIPGLEFCVPRNFEYLWCLRMPKSNPFCDVQTFQNMNHESLSRSNQHFGAKVLRFMKMSNTFSNGCLGSHTDEERSEMRYVMRIAKSVSHQNFERILHFLRGVCLLECLFIPTIPLSSNRARCECSPPLS